MLQNLSNVELIEFVDRKLKYTLYGAHVKSYPPPGSDRLELLFFSLLSDAQCHSKPSRVSQYLASSLKFLEGFQALS